MNLTVSNLLTCALLNPLQMMDGPTIAGATLTTTTTTSTTTATTTTMVSATATATLNASSASTFASTGTFRSVGNICALSEGATALVTTSSVLSVLLIAIDQYFAVVDPLRYRARVDKLKSAVLIVSVWLVSAAFGLIASLNPSPRSLWLSCTTLNSSDNSYLLNTSSSSVDSAFAFFSNTSVLEEEEEETELMEEEVIDVGGTAMPALLRTVESIKISHGLFDNSTEFFRGLANDSITYGLVYALVHSVLAYLLPFAGVCWIYVSIYAAAHRNSERTRRTGSRPILSSASFCEDPYGYARPPQQQQQQQQQQPADAYAEEIRRIPKISSLSSIDETSETAHSANQASHRRSFSSTSDTAPSTDDKATSAGGAVVFTVGLQPVEVTGGRVQDRKDGGSQREQPVTVLKAHFLEDERSVATYHEEDLVRSKFRDSPADRRRKSSHDLVYEAVSAVESSGWIAGDSSDSESEDERRRYGYFDSLEVPATVHRLGSRRPSDYFLSLAVCETANSQGDNSRRSSFEKKEFVVRVDEEEEDEGEGESSIERKIPGAEGASATPLNRRVSVGDCSSSHLSTGIGKLDGKKSRRLGRRSSKLSGAEETQAAGKNSESNNMRSGHAEPSSCLLTPVVTITPAPNKPGGLNRVSSVRSTSSSYINSLKYRISNGSLFRYREETRAARISALVIVMGLICWSPYMLLSLMKNLPQYSSHEFPHEYDVLALSFLIVAAYASPLLFGYRSRRVKRELRRFFCFRRELSYKNNRSLMAKKVLKRRHSSTLSQLEMEQRYNIFNCVYGRSRWPKEKVQFVQVPDTALAVETCRSSFSSGASTQISSTSTEEC
ncbi:hypothetical protein EAI_12478 [Harpegnathos saltator]|uniref:G-protein coupled receptors family 1 profile domain-containing protein n=1 Tax=Harpegnathos saltator TaxID=610380 RepID=E2B4H2_HARSA|nr:hypothetical protein EAI_12478 [Harpegnathos saltator]